MQMVKEEKEGGKDERRQAQGRNDEDVIGGKANKWRGMKKSTYKQIWSE